ncbi:MAG: exosortase/archaeosortase family protein [archaeon]|nr:exosortase/archaeosortase family protein [archaeon]
MVKFDKRYLIFLLKFFVIFLFLEFFIFATNLTFLQEFIAKTQAEFFGLRYAGNFVFVSDGIFEIVPECTGIVSTSILASIIFSLKKPEMKKKLLIFGLGFVLLFIVNYLRVLSIIWIGMEYGIENAEILHVTSWFASSGLVIALWYYFTKRITGAKNFKGFL